MVTDIGSQPSGTSLQRSTSSPTCLLLRLHSLHSVTATLSIVFSTSSYFFALCFRFMTVLQMSTWHIEFSWTVCRYFDAGATEISGESALHPAGPIEHFNHVFFGCSRTGKCPWGTEVNTVKGAPQAHLQASIYLSGSLSHFTATCW